MFLDLLTRITFSSSWYKTICLPSCVNISSTQNYSITFLFLKNKRKYRISEKNPADTFPATMTTPLWSHLWHPEGQGLQQKSITLLKKTSQMCIRHHHWNRDRRFHTQKLELDGKQCSHHSQRSSGSRLIQTIWATDHLLEIQCSYWSPKWVHISLTPPTQQRAASVHLVYGTGIAAAYLDQLHALFLCLGWNTLNCWLQILFPKGNSHFTTFPNLLSGYNTPVQAFWHCCTKLKSKYYIHFLCTRQGGITLPTVTCVHICYWKYLLLCCSPSLQLRLTPDQEPGHSLMSSYVHTANLSIAKEQRFYNYWPLSPATIC